MRDDHWKDYKSYLLFHARSAQTHLSYKTVEKEVLHWKSQFSTWGLTFWLITWGITWSLSLSLSLIINKKVSTTKIVNFLTPGTARNCQFHDSGAGVERFKLSGVELEILVVCVGGGGIFFRGMGSGAPVGPNPRKLLNFSDFNTIISSYYRWSYTPLIYMYRHSLKNVIRIFFPVKHISLSLSSDLSPSICISWIWIPIHAAMLITCFASCLNRCFSFLK